MEIDKPITIKELLKDEIEKNEYRVVAAKFNNEYKNLQFQIKEDGIIELIDLSQKEGMKVYIRTLTYIAGKAFEKICPGEKMTVNYQLANSMFYDADRVEIDDEFIQKMNKEMKSIVEKDLPIK